LGRATIKVIGRSSVLKNIEKETGGRAQPLKKKMKKNPKRKSLSIWKIL